MNGQGPFGRFINQTEMVSLSSFARTVAWVFAFFAFTVTACILMLTKDEKWIQWGFQLAVAVLGGLGVASGIGAVNTKTLRTTAREYAPVVEAKARGEAAAHAAIAVDHADNVVAPTANGPAPLTTAVTEEPQWASGDPRAGIL